MKCPICKKCVLEKKKADYLFLDKNIGKFDAKICTYCNEKIFDELTSKKISSKIKKLGLWGLGSRTKMLESLRKRKRFISSAGGWKDMENIEKIKEEIYRDRKISNRTY